MDQWYYTYNGTQQGPVPLSQLTQLFQSGQLAPDTLVWRDGMTNWVAANTLPELGVMGAAPVLGYGVGETVYQAGEPGPMGFRYADFWIRFGGALIDGVLVYVANQAVSFAVGAVVGLGFGNSQNITIAAGAMAIVISLTMDWLYFAFMWSSTKQASLGEMACGLRVVDMNGNRISFGRATGRHFATLLSGLICYIGYFMMLWSDKKQTLHDQLAKTLVVYK